MILSNLTILNALELAGWAVAAIMAVFAIFDRQRRARRNEDDQVANNLITNLRTTTDFQEKEITTLRTDKIEQGKEIAHLQGQVKVLTDILQGRDPATQSTLSHIPEIVAIAKQNSEAIERLTNVMTNFMEQMLGAMPKNEPLKL